MSARSARITGRGIERTLHRISAIRNRSGKVVGLDAARGARGVWHDTHHRDLVLSGKSVLLLGKPGVGKTTMLREIARVLADDAKKRVIIVGYFQRDCGRRGHSASGA